MRLCDISTCQIGRSSPGALSWTLQIGVLIRGIYICHTAPVDHVCFIASGGQRRVWAITEQEFPERSRGCRKPGKPPQSFLLKGKSKRNALISENDPSLIVPLDHPPSGMLIGPKHGRDDCPEAILGESCILNGSHDLYMRITSEGRLQLRNGLSMSEVITLINF